MVTGRSDFKTMSTPVAKQCLYQYHLNLHNYEINIRVLFSKQFPLQEIRFRT